MLVVTVSDWTVSARPAAAHEFRLALVTHGAATTAEPGSDGRDVLDGFRLAIDRSPDVSHPPGVDAGDHLGGVDVDISVINGTRAASAAKAVADQAAAGLTAVVVIAPEPTTRAVTAALAGSRVLVVTATGPGGADRAHAGSLHLTQRPGPPFDSAAAEEIALAFRQARGRDLSASAALGYDAARLLDVAIASAGSSVEDLDAVVAAGAVADDVLVSTDAAAPDLSSSNRPRGLRPSAAAGSRTPVRDWLAPALVLAAAGALVAALRLRHATRRRRAPDRATP